jgi:hypothetical protein
MLSLAAAVAAPASAESAGLPSTAPPLPEEGVRPLSRASAGADGDRLPPHVTAPLSGQHVAVSRSDLPVHGAAPLEHGHDGPPVAPAKPLGAGPPTPPKTRIDPKSTLMTRVDVLVGPVWRIQRVDTMLATSLEVGQMHGFAGTFHTEVIISGPQRPTVRAVDVPIGFGAVARGRLRNRPLYGSVGLSAGILVHRAATDDDVIHRVDPDFRLPIRFAWTITRRVGLSLAVVQGYSVRNRTYEQRGGEVWARHAYRVALLIGLHWDQIVGRVKARRRAAAGGALGAGQRRVSGHGDI